MARIILIYRWLIELLSSVALLFHSTIQRLRPTKIQNHSYQKNSFAIVVVGKSVLQPDCLCKGRNCEAIGFAISQHPWNTSPTHLYQAAIIAMKGNVGIPKQ